MATKNRIMLNCLQQLSMVYGTSVNIYAEDKLYTMLDDALEFCFKETFWDRHIKKIKVSVVNGVPERSDLNNVIREFEDILSIIDEDGYTFSRGQATIIPEIENPPYNTYIRSEDPTKLFRVCDTTWSGDIWVVFRSIVKPKSFASFLNGEIIPLPEKGFTYNPNEEMPFDALALQYRTCFNYMVIKGDNQTATQSFMQQFMQRNQQLKMEESNNVINMDDNDSSPINTEWR